MATIKVKFRPSTVRGKAGVVCYQLCHRQENRQITTDMRIFPHWWDGERRELVVTPGNESTIFSYRKRIDADLAAVRQIIRELDSIGNEYTLSEVIERFQAPKSEIGMLDYLRKEIGILRQNGQFSTSRNYLRTLNSFSSFLDNYDIPLSVLDTETICKYEKWLWGRKVSRNSSSFYMRILRAAYNKAVHEQLVAQAFPFHEVYTGIAKTSKRAVSEKTILKLQRLDLSRSSALALSRDLFVFSYCTRGMAFVDMAYLKKENIGKGVISYCRHKTGQSLTLRIEPCMEAILRRYIPVTSKSPYVFPIITAENPDRAYLQYQTGLNYHNQKLKRLGRLIGEALPLSSYTPRHSWATAARNHNIPVAVISAGMGHTSEKTTLIYLDSLDNSVIDNANNGILKDLNSTVS
ncbi:site-specific integrase [uncultured Parabacteroides sp.]|uniref:tyrosine-type recombinase/integrase n=1 Tax=uncultured Parabacteroides sp. TaxID=512312 RepID=UPI002633910D|nr:site-specific integrase [uncultured Parabacteroides sp.]